MIRIFLFIFVLTISSGIELAGLANPQKGRSITADDFTRNRPQAKKRTQPTRTKKPPRTYYPTSTSVQRPENKSSFQTLEVGVTIWKLQAVQGSRRGEVEPVARRVAADTRFREGDLLRLSIESPRSGYLYVIDRDWFTNGSPGETKLVFPQRGDDNRLEAGKLIDIPAEDLAPFKASPAPNQAGELLTIIVTSSPLPLSISDQPLPISSVQLSEFEKRWGGLTERFELNGGIGQTRTDEERQAAAREGARQLTRDDPIPQTIYLVTPKDTDGLLFNLLLSYVR